MDNLKLNKFLTRFFIVFFVNFIVVAGDHSMDILGFNFREISFSFYFITYWLIIWYVSSLFNAWIHKKQDLSIHIKHQNNYLLFFFNFVFGLIAAFFANWLYREGDIYFFNMSETWSSVPIFNPELTMSLFTFYMMIFTADIFFKSSIRRKEDQLKMEKLKQETTMAQYLLLKSRIEPHFLFNSLSVLSSIIHSDINLAEEFILRLSKTLRYVIEKNELALVPLEEEIRFVDNYFFLIRNRFDEGIVFKNSIDESIIQNSYIPPASLQLLIENAVKHNKFTTETPLQIHLFNDKNHLIVKNNINLRDDIFDSTNQGLENLTQRYSYFSDEAVSITINETDFIVSMPILTKTDYERFNI
jgi:two-component system, LytTR family, sensor kinase